MTKVVIKNCKCDKGQKKIYIQNMDGFDLMSKVVGKCVGCQDEIFPNKIDNGEWVFSKGKQLCVFQYIEMKTGGLFLYEERRI